MAGDVALSKPVVYVRDVQSVKRSGVILTLAPGAVTLRVPISALLPIFMSRPTYRTRSHTRWSAREKLPLMVSSTATSVSVTLLRALTLPVSSEMCIRTVLDTGHRRTITVTFTVFLCLKLQRPSLWPSMIKLAT